MTRSPFNIKMSKQRCKINTIICIYNTKNAKGCSLLIIPFFFAFVSYTKITFFNVVII